MKPLFLTKPTKQLETQPVESHTDPAPDEIANEIISHFKHSIQYPILSTICHRHDHYKYSNRIQIRTTDMKNCAVMLLVAVYYAAGGTHSMDVAMIGGEEVSEELFSLLPEIDAVINQAKMNIWNQMQADEPLWNFPPWLGSFFISQYYFDLKAFNISKDFNFTSKLNPEVLRDKLINEQRADGSWEQLIDLNKKQGSLDATIFNYWFLKDYGVATDDDAMRRAKKFILDHGGIENAQVMTKYKLAIFGVYQWIFLTYVPLSMFYNGFPLYSYGYIKDYVAQWVYPHLTALAYFRYHKTVFPVSRVCLQQLRTSRSDHCQEYKSSHPGLTGFTTADRSSYVDNLLEQVIKLRGPRGAIGAYTISTLLNLLTFKDYELRYGSDNQFVDFFTHNHKKSIQFVEQMYFNKRVPYEGSLDDGRYWDTILSAFALLQAGEQQSKLAPTVDYLIETAVQPNGGIPYGLQFEYAPDIDDTAMLLILYGRMRDKYPSSPSYNEHINRTYSWLKSNQNSDGGFPAFDKDKNDDQYLLIKLVFKLTAIDKSAEIFDPSCPDIVGHLLEGMGVAGIRDYKVVGKMMEFLKGTRQDGMWSARWGINYVYAVGAVLPGLARIGYDLNTDWVIKIMKRLLQVQQEDGGFGEDSESYNMGKYVQGVTTASMTSWGLLSYIETAHLNIPELQPAIVKATKYLINNFKQHGNKFHDRSVVGTGHRGVINLQYPVYAYSFPLVALARVRKLINGQYTQKVDNQLSKFLNAHNNDGKQL